MTSKQAQKELQRINKLPPTEKAFYKKMFLHDYLILVAHKGRVIPKRFKDIWFLIVERIWIEKTYLPLWSRRGRN